MSKKIYRETLRLFEEDFRQFLLIAAVKDSHASEQDKRRYLAMLHCIADSFEVLVTLADELKPKDGLACPFTEEGLDYYRQQFKLGDQQWENVQGFFSELGSVVGADLLTYMRGKLRVQCTGCWVHAPEPGAYSART